MGVSCLSGRCWVRYLQKDATGTLKVSPQKSATDPSLLSDDVGLDSLTRQGREREKAFESLSKPKSLKCMQAQPMEQKEERIHFTKRHETKTRAFGHHSATSLFRRSGFLSIPARFLFCLVRHPLVIAMTAPDHRPMQKPGGFFSGLGSLASKAQRPASPSGEREQHQRRARD